MKFETKYNIGDKVWVMVQKTTLLREKTCPSCGHQECEYTKLPKIIQREICTVAADTRIEYDGSVSSGISYELRGGDEADIFPNHAHYLDEKEVFATKEEAEAYYANKKE